MGTPKVTKEKLKIQWVVKYEEGEVFRPTDVPEIIHITKEAAKCSEEVYLEFLRSRKEM